MTNKMTSNEIIVGAASSALVIVSVLPTESELEFWLKAGTSIGLLYLVFHLMTKTVPTQLREKDEAHAADRAANTAALTKSLDDLTQSNKDVNKVTESMLIELRQQRGKG